MIVGILAAMALPVVRYGIRRQKEIDLRHKLRTITAAIDRYNDYRVAGLITDPPSLGQGNYPKDFDELIEGVDLVDGQHVKFLRPRDLIDPMTGKDEWDTFSSTDDPESYFSDKANIYDVRSTSTRLSLDGKTRYNEW